MSIGRQPSGIARPSVLSVTEVTRRAIFDALVETNIPWCGRLKECEFVARIFNTTELPSNDRRYKTAYDDIEQHRDRNNDWTEDWILTDPRFDLLHAKDETFLGFLVETLHPLVQVNTETVIYLAKTYNELLRVDGWEVYEKQRISDRPVFHFRKHGTRAEVFSEPTGWAKVDRQLNEVRQKLGSAVNEEQYQIVGTLCREAFITVAEQVFDANKHRSRDGVEVSKSDAFRMLEAYFDYELGGYANEEVRSHAKASLKLANALQHKRTADFRMAALCAEGTMATINIVAILSGRREQI